MNRTCAVAPCATAGHAWAVRVISQREFRNNSAAVMDAVEAGETFQVTRNGVVIAELRPLSGRRHLTAEELVARHRRLPASWTRAPTSTCRTWTRRTCPRCRD
jgi:antitoxin (DNA-binding transcriptional repressor) of toxin-antitoxin stability system